jgi:tetratricopeptide (TPR) repeat protein
MKGWIIFAVLIWFATPATQVTAQSTDRVPDISTADEAAEWLMELYTNRDYELGGLEGDRLSEKFSDAVEIDALRIINMARSDRLTEAVDDATVLHNRNPDNPWAVYAKAVALRWDDERRDEALNYIEKGLEIAPEMSEFHALHIAWLNATDKKNEAWEASLQAIEIADNPVRIMEMKGFMMNQVMNSRDDISRNDLFEYYASIRETDPDNLSAHFFAGVYHANAGEPEKAVKLLKRASEISTAPAVNSRYWQTLMRYDGYSQDEKMIMISESAESLKERRPETPAMLMAIANAYNNLGMTENRDHYYDIIAEKYSDSPSMEWVMINRQREFRSDHSDEIQAGNEEIIAEYRQMLWSYLEKPEHHNTNLKGGVYLNLFGSYRNDESPDPDTLWMLLEGMAKYNPMNPHIVFTEGPASYVEKGGDANRALELANRGFDKMRQTVERRKEFGSISSDEEYERELDRADAFAHNAIGWIHFHNNNMEKAEEHLVTSHELAPGNRSNLYRLGQLYEALGQPENAESYYVMGVGTTGMGNNPNEEALKELYEKMRGSLDGYDDYLELVLAGDRETRRERILADRHENPETPPAFELSDIEGNSIDSGIMDGRVVAINFWGKWCGPCVAEMPDIQELYEKYRDDDEVLVLTINNDPILSELIEWMDEHEYTFPTLRDDGYIPTAGVSVFPTTWFLDRSGSIVYTQRGYTSELVEEFSWRIEELRSER